MRPEEEIPVIPVRGDIKLGQFLKLADLAVDGVAARELIQGGDVTVNGVVDTRRGHVLAAGDLVEVSYPDETLSAQVGQAD